MKNLKKTTALLLAFASLAVAAGTAWAGAKWSLPLSINTSQHYAFGVPADVRSSSDGSAYVYCTVNAVGSTQSVSCYGSQSSASFACSSTSASLVSAAASINGDSYVGVYWDTKGNCTNIFVYNGSPFSPKQP